MCKVIIKDSNSERLLIHWYCRPTYRKLTNNFIEGLLKIQFEMGRLSQEVGAIKDKIKNIEDGEFPPKGYSEEYSYIQSFW